eukprot:m.164034 g.164034  ORF g.164034 m.164034 type:complete len:608 (+) comp18111_c0_seq41:148-1971(+)
MEFDEILSYKPSLDVKGQSSSSSSAASGSGSSSLTASGKGKRKRTGIDDGFAVPKLQRGIRSSVQIDSPADAAGSSTSESAFGITDEDDERTRALKMMAADNAPRDEGVFDLPALRRMALALERKATKNQELRVKFPTDPSKFMASEADLNDQIKEFSVVATAPQLYPDLVRLGCTKTILNLLHHENTDIASAAIELLQEVTDGDALDDDAHEDNAKALVEALFGSQLLTMLVATLQRFQEPQDSDGVHKILGVFENILDLDPQLGTRIVKECGILQWLLGRIKGKKFDSNKLYASEILAILLQTSDENKETLASLNGIDRLLRGLKPFFRRDPTDTEEHEYMENLFDTVCSVIQLKANVELFLHADGVELMVIMLRERKLSQHGALKVLDHVMCRLDDMGGLACEDFVERQGLKSLFPAFMKTPHPGKGSKKKFSEADFEEHVCSITSSLLHNIKNEEQELRVLRKFVEKDFAKLDRLVELHLKYLRAVQACIVSINVPPHTNIHTPHIYTPTPTQMPIQRTPTHPSTHPHPHTYTTHTRTTTTMHRHAHTPAFKYICIFLWLIMNCYGHYNIHHVAGFKRATFNLCREQCSNTYDITCVTWNCYV